MQIYVYNAPKYVCRLGSAWTRWGSLSTPQTPSRKGKKILVSVIRTRRRGGRVWGEGAPLHSGAGVFFRFCISKWRFLVPSGRFFTVQLHVLHVKSSALGLEKWLRHAYGEQRHPHRPHYFTAVPTQPIILVLFIPLHIIAQN